jgi:CheY-like chemotaxis protein
MVEDDVAQREVRTVLLESEGHQVVERGEDLLLMDLRTPSLEDGLALIRETAKREPRPKVVVLSGWTADLRGREEAEMVHAVLEKPCPTRKLLNTIRALLAMMVCALSLRGEAPRDWKAHAPVLFERADTIGKNSDVPLLMYAEWNEGEKSLTFTVIFSNEDGGTSTRSLMARWGRTTDIEYLYKVWFDEAGKPARREIQTKDHKDVAFEGPFEGLRPLLEPVTKNNMVAAAQAPQGKRIELEPVMVDLTNHAREHVMDLYPSIAKAAREELIREKKIRPYGVMRGEDISDPQNYAYLEFKSTQREGARVAFGLQTRGMARMQMSHLGVGGNTVERSGWMRLALELPPGTKLSEVSQLAVACYAKGACLVEKIAFLEVGGQRREVALGAPQEIPAGQMWFTTLR